MRLIKDALLLELCNWYDSGSVHLLPVEFKEVNRKRAARHKGSFSTPNLAVWLDGAYHYQKMLPLTEQHPVIVNNFYVR
jgi:hypothetical protein